MSSHLLRFVVVAVFTACSSSLTAAGPRYTDPQQTDADFPDQGEYRGRVGDEQRPLGIQVIAEGQGRFQAVAYFGGLPGDGWDGEPPIRAAGQRQDGQIRFDTQQGSAVLKEGTITVYDADGDRVGRLAKVTRSSPTLGAKPPSGAVVLFDGTAESLENWRGGRMTEDGLLMEGTTSKQTFGDHQVHLEFRLAYQPEDRGQGRSNSGIYVQGRYEVQILDSFGLEGKHNECGGIYSVKDPGVNMCLPPLSWQTYDIDYTAARYDAQGKLTANPRITVRHNGVVIHQDVELPGERSTTAAPVGPGPEPGPVYLQNHGCPLRFRNIWVVPR
jgi:hypothetical protein